jgi:hypothetical protein
MTCTSYEAPHNAILSILHLLPLCYVEIFHSSAVNLYYSLRVTTHM